MNEAEGGLGNGTVEDRVSRLSRSTDSRNVMQETSPVSRRTRTDSDYDGGTPSLHMLTQTSTCLAESLAPSIGLMKERAEYSIPWSTNPFIHSTHHHGHADHVAMITVRQDHGASGRSGIDVQMNPVAETDAPTASYAELLRFVFCRRPHDFWHTTRSHDKSGVSELYCIFHNPVVSSVIVCP